MIIRSLRLRNIRSYKEMDLDFPQGSVLLSGDIGSGKSTILLAIEFALFGIKRGELSGSALLRHGAKEGSVELEMQVAGKEVTIRRALKRVSDDIKQDAGSIIIDGVKTDATAVELKARVLELLGYPKELITKSKDLIYRYTVYTPQEQMKQILLEDPDLRLDTLRKLFGIDKYKRIRENAVIYIRELKNRIRELDAKTYGIDEKKKAMEEKIRQETDLQRKLDSLKPRLEEVKAMLAKRQEAVAKDEEEMRQLQKLKNDVTLIETRLMDKFLSARRNKEASDKLASELAQAGKEPIPDMDKITATIAARHKQQSSLEDDLLSINRLISEASVRTAQSEDVKRKIQSLDRCPMCEQDVTADHKCTIAAREDETIKKYSLQRSESENKAAALMQQIKAVKDEIALLQQEQRKAAVAMEKVRQIKDKEKRVEELKIENAEIKKEIGSLNAQKIKANEAIEKLKGIDERYAKAKAGLQQIADEERRLEMEHVSTRTQAAETGKVIDLYRQEIMTKESFRKEIARIAKLRNWLEEHFLNLMVVMEKHIMSQLHQEFNELFIDWFNILIEDETLNVRLDDQFTPVIEQNGYETVLENLSGGEKTSVALAYRLSLNKVINDFISHIMTRDIIMLDEPTDGFSDEQLDKVREVLEQINAKQVIIVSHEAKVETFVDSVIRISKAEHKSAVSA